MTSELQSTYNFLSHAKRPEDVFGGFADNVTPEFRRLAKIVHEDKCKKAADKKIAHEAFILLQQWKDVADRRIAKDLYGKLPMMQVAITNGKNIYEIDQHLTTDNLCNVYLGTHSIARILVKVSRHPSVNDLVANEAAVLRAILKHNGGPAKCPHIPVLLDAFSMLDESTRRQANVFEYADGFVSLTDVMKAYPEGIDPRDAAWMARRLLAALGVAHQAGYVHGAVLPENFLINPKDHNGVLIDWSYAVKVGEKLRAIPSGSAVSYPPELRNKVAVTPGLDIYMAAITISQLLNDDGPGVNRMKAFFRSCLMKSAASRPSDAWQLFDEFTELIEALYGPRKFRVFNWPRKQPTT